MMKQVKVGIIGLGFMGTTHFRIHQANPKSRVVAVADVDAAKQRGDIRKVIGNIGGGSSVIAGNAGGASAKGIDGQIAALQEKMSALQKDLSALLKEETTEETEEQAELLQAQILALQAQIAALEAQKAQEAAQAQQKQQTQAATAAPALASEGPLGTQVDEYV